MNNAEYKLIYVLLLVSISLTVLTSFQNYTAAVGSDERAYIMAAQDILNLKLLREDPLLETLYGKTIDKSEAVYVYYGSYILERGKVHLITTLGFPLILAASMALFGFNSVFFVNCFFLGLFMLSYFFMVSELFSNERNNQYMAFFSVLFAILTNNLFIDLSLTPWLDLSALSFLMLSLYFLFKVKNTINKRIYYLCLSTFFLGLSCTIRLTNALVLIPYLLYMFLDFRRDLSTKVVLIAALFLALGMIPIFVQNYLLSGNIFLPAQVRTASELTLSNLLPALIKNLLDILNNLILLPLFVLGLLFISKKPHVRHVIFLVPVILFVFFSTYRVDNIYIMRRYLVAVYPFFVAISSLGLIRLLETLEEFNESHINPQRLYFYVTLLGLFVITADTIFNLLTVGDLDIRYTDQAIILCGIVFLSFRYLPRQKLVVLSMLLLFIPVLLLPTHFPVAHPKQFQLDDVPVLDSFIEHNTKDGGIILACRYLSEVIDLHTVRRSVAFPDISGRLSQNDVISHLLDSKVSVYIVDNEDRNNCSKYVLSAAERFNLTAVAQINARELGLLDQCGKAYCTIYELKR